MAGFPVGYARALPTAMTNMLPTVAGTALSAAGRVPAHLPEFPGWGTASGVIPLLASRALGAAGMAFTPTMAGDATLDGNGYSIPTIPHSTQLANAVQQLAGHPQVPPTAGGSNSMNTLNQATWGWPGTDPDNLNVSPYALNGAQSASISPERFLGLANGTDTLETLSGFPQNVLPQASVAPAVQPTQYTVPSTPDYAPQAIPDVQAGISDPTDWNAKLGTLSALTGGLAVPMIPQFNSGGSQQSSAPPARAKVQSQRPQVTPPRATQAGQGYTVQPGMSMQPTNVPGQTQLNLIQNQLRFNDPEYQQLYALRDAQVRQALQSRGIPYEEAMAAVRMGVPLNL